MMNNYNFSIKHREEINVSSKKIWDIISSESNLDLYHPCLLYTSPRPRD